MLFDSSLRKELARTFGATLVVVVTIVLTMMLIRTLGLAANGSVAAGDVALLLGFTALGHLPTMLSLSLFVAVVSTLTRMYRASEMTIWFASGVGLTRFVRPILRVSWPVVLMVALLALFVWPWGNQRTTELRDRYERRSDLSRVAPGQFQSSSDGRRVFFLERDSADAASGRNIFILNSAGDTESVTSARNGHIEFEGADRWLQLDKGQRNEENLKTREKTLSNFESYRVLAGERALSAAEDQPPKARNTDELLRLGTPRFLGELTWRIGLALGAANLLLLAIGLSATNPRRAGNWNLLFALMTFIVYFNLINLSQAWVASSKLSMGAALMAIHASMFVLALALMWWRDRGSASNIFSIRRPCPSAKTPHKPPATAPTKAAA